MLNSITVAIKTNRRYMLVVDSGQTINIAHGEEELKWRMTE